MEPAPGAHGGRLDPAHPGGSPDDRHRPGAALRRTRRAPSSTRSCATWTRTCTSARTAAGSRSGSYAHRPILHDPDEIPSVEEAALSPTEYPFTEDDFVEQMQHALELMPEIVGDESVGIKYAINGLLSLTPDTLPILGETPEVEGPVVGRGGVGQGGPGRGPRAGRVDGRGRARDRPAGLRHRPLLRAPEERRARRARASEAFNKTYGIVHPGEQWGSNRDVRLSPFHERERELDAVFYEAAGWERPHWYASNAGLVEEYGVEGREAEWDSRWWSPIINAEHLAMRDRAGDVRPHGLLRLRHRGPGALDVRAARRPCARWT